MTGRIKRWLALVAMAGTLATAVVAAPPAPPAARGAGTVLEAVDWRVFHDTRRIVVVIRMAFYLRIGSRTGAPRYGVPSQGIIDRIVGAIESSWRGKFKCYDFHVLVTSRAIESREEATDREIDIMIDARPINIRMDAASFPKGPRGPKPYLSDDPSDALRPERYEGDPIKYGTIFTATASPLRYAHEVGHLLGLDDGYDAKTDDDYPDAPQDNMNDTKLPVTPEMITKVVRRSGEVDESEITCPLNFTAGPSSINAVFSSIADLRIDARACDYDPPSSDPEHAPRPIEWDGTVSASGGHIGLDTGGSGRIRVSFTMPVPGRTNIRLGGSSVLWTTFHWGNDGVPVADAAMRLNQVDTATFPPGPPLMPLIDTKALRCE